MCKLTIITINYNNCSGLRKTIESVIGQINKNFDFIVIDGDSNDGSLQVIHEYKDKISYWISEADTGIYNAMNKGIIASHSEYLLFLNSGDFLNTNSAIDEMMPELNSFDLIAADIGYFKNKKTVAIKNLSSSSINFDNLVNIGIHHQSTFISSVLFTKIGLYNESSKISGDWQFFISALFEFDASYKYINKVITIYNFDGISSLESSKYLIRKEKQSFLKLLISSDKFKIDLVDLFDNRHHLEYIKKLSFFGKIKILLGVA